MTNSQRSYTALFFCPVHHIHIFDLCGNAQNEVDNDGSQEGNGQNGGTKAVVKTTLASHADALCSPVVGGEGVEHSSHGDKSEETSRDLTDPVAEVEETDGETAEDDGEVQPAEEGTLVGEEDLGLDARGEGNALACESRC